MYMHLKHANIKREYYLYAYTAWQSRAGILWDKRVQVKISQLWFPENKIAKCSGWRMDWTMLQLATTILN